MKLFLTVFAAILAAAAVILTGIYAKARLDQWEQAKWAFIAEMNNVNARTKAICDGYMAEARQWAASGIVANVNLYTEAALKESQESLKRIREIQQRVIVHLQNKPFWIPLTADEQHALADAKAAIAKSANPTPMPTPNQEKQDESMKPTTEASEAERQRRREAQEIYPHAKAVSPREMVATPTPTPDPRGARPATPKLRQSSIPPLLSIGSFASRKNIRRDASQSGGMRFTPWAVRSF